MKRLILNFVAIGFMSSAAYADDLDFVLVNGSSVALTGFYLSPASSLAWEDNMLRGRRLAAGTEANVVVADGLVTCIYDIRGEFSDGSTAEDFDVDLCDLGEYTYGD